jgi:hypothetical protein
MNKNDHSLLTPVSPHPDLYQQRARVIRELIVTPTGSSNHFPLFLPGTIQNSYVLFRFHSSCPHPQFGSGRFEAEKNRRSSQSAKSVADDQTTRGIKDHQREE